MIIQCLSFGTIWDFMGRRDPATNNIIRWRSYYLNRTGWVRGTRKIYRSRSKGYVRINGSAILFSDPSELLMLKFESTEVEDYQGSNRLLITRKAKGNPPVDGYLVAIRSATEGNIDFQSTWRTHGVRTVASSEFRKEGGPQEVMLFMPTGGKIVTSLGMWEVVCRKEVPVLSLVG